MGMMMVMIIRKKMRRSPLSSKKLLKRVAKLHSKDIDLGLERFQALLVRLGNPEKSLPPVIHVAGTNGKGSTIAFLRSSFEAVGYVVHAFTSPHLVHMRECITLSGHEIEEDRFVELLEEVISANDGAAMTVFEAITAAAFLGFSRHKGHVVLLETGLGGLGDTTNVVEYPVLSVITTISKDHVEFLGTTLGDIAHHKAGVIKSGVPVVMALQEREAYEVIRDKAKTMGARLYRQGSEWFVKRASQRLIFEGWNGDHAWPLPSLIGDHQINNAGVALACLEVLKDQFNLPEEAVRNGLQSVDWPGRLEQIQVEEMLPKGWELWLDGGHNQGAAKVLRQQFKKWNDKPLYLIWSMLQTKDSTGFLEPLVEFADHVYTVPIPKNKQSRTAEDLAQIVQDVGGTATACDDINSALSLMKTKGKEPARVLICGSLYLLGAFLKMRSKKQDELSTRT
jgi:dihydrofolate synthase / folylpolyglutamate synthase